jgi:AraC-like DNA-binding protein
MIERFKEHAVLTSSDSSELEKVVSRLWAPHRLTVFERQAELKGRVNAINIGAITVGYIHYGADVSLRVPDGAVVGYHITVPVAGKAITRYMHGNVSASSGVAAVITPGQPATIDWPETCSQISAKFERNAIELELEELLGRPISRPIRFANEMRLTEGRQRWFTALMLLEQESSRPGGMLNYELPMRHLERYLIESFLFSQPHNYSAELRDAGMAAGPKALRQAMDFMESRAGAPLTVKDVARATGVSVRALQDVFRNRLEMTPMEYLREVRLRRAHEELRNASSGQLCVRNVAHRWGFLHAGRFSADYRRKFGEFPSTTMRGGSQVRFQQAPGDMN